MEEQDYIELNTLLSKLRVICMKNMGEIDANLNADNMRISRRMREEKRRKDKLWMISKKVQKKCKKQL